MGLGRDRMSQSSIVVGSLAAVAHHEGVSLAESFIDAEAVIIVDVSGSMSARDSRGGQSRYDVALQELATLQTDLPGKLAIIAFSSEAEFVPGGEPFFEGGGTNLTGALQFAKVCDVPGMKLIIISDGAPNDKQEALAAARTIKATISTVYVGPEGGRGAAFLEELARANDGSFGEAARVVALADKVRPMLVSGKGNNE